MGTEPAFATFRPVTFSALMNQRIYYEFYKRKWKGLDRLLCVRELIRILPVRVLGTVPVGQWPWIHSPCQGHPIPRREVGNCQRHGKEELAVAGNAPTLPTHVQPSLTLGWDMCALTQLGKGWDVPACPHSGEKWDVASQLCHSKGWVQPHPTQLFSSPGQLLSRAGQAGSPSLPPLEGRGRSWLEARLFSWAPSPPPPRPAPRIHPGLPYVRGKEKFGKSWILGVITSYGS